MATRYMWSKWNKTTEQIYDVTKFVESWIGSNKGATPYSSYSINGQTGIVTLSGTVPSGSNALSYWYGINNDNTYFIKGYNRNGNVSTSPTESNDYGWRAFIGKVTQDAKGSTSYGNISTGTASSYPANGIDGNYWYVSLGSDNIDPTALTYTDPVNPGGEINLTITPSSSASLGGTITYTIQTTTNGTDYYDQGTTTGTTFKVTVPENAIIWNVRVFAKDNTGFVSNTYVYGNGETEWVTVNQTGIMPLDETDLGYLLGTDITPFLVSNSSYTGNAVQISGTITDPTASGGTALATISASTTVGTAVMLTITDEEREDFEEDKEYKISITATISTGASSTTTAEVTYTIKKFDYDDTTLEGVMAGTAKAIRIRRQYNTQIVGKNFPKEIIKDQRQIDENYLHLATASQAQVLNGYTFFAGDPELKTGTALSVQTDVAPENLFNGKKAYKNDGSLVTGTALSQVTDVAAINLFNGIKAYTSSGQLITGTALSQSVNVTANNIPTGVTAYNQAGKVITGNGSEVLKYSEHAHQFNQNSTSITFTCSFTIKIAIAYMSSLGASNRGVTGGVILPGGTSGQFRINDGNSNSGCTGSFSFSGNKLTASLEVPSYISSGRMYVDFVAIGM